MLSNLNYAMVVVSDMARSVAFYRDRLGLKLRFESPGWSEFDTGTTTLALHGGGEGGAAPHHGKPQAGTCTVGFYVDNLHEVYELLEGRGVVFVMPPTERPNEGIHLAVCTDPDGLGISIAQPIKKG
jgi:lactoylglutathione lyase